MTEEFRLPAGWAWTTVQQVGIGNEQPVLTGPFGSNLGRQDFQPSGVPVLTIGCLTEQGLDSSKVMYIPPKKAAELNRYRVKAGDLLFSRMATVGRAGYVTTEFSGAIFNYHLMRLRLSNELIHRLYFLYWVRGAKRVEDYVREVNHGATRDGINTSELLALPIALPPLNEQRRIVDAIETQFTRLDAAVAALKRAQANLKRYRASVLKAACEGRLVPTEAELARTEGRDYEPAPVLLERILAERRRQWEAEAWQKEIEKAQKKAAQAKRKAAGLPARIRDLEPDEWQTLPEEVYASYLPKNEKWKTKYKEPQPPDTSELPELPEGWCWVAVEQTADVQLGRQRSPQNHHGPYMRPYLRAANATWEGVNLEDVMEMNFSPAEFERYELKAGDILLSEASGSADEVGKPFIWQNEIPDCCFQNTLIRVQAIGVEIPYLHLHFYKDARTGRFGRIAKGVGIYHLGAERLATMPVAVPPLTEQNRIVAEVERHFSIIDQLEKTVEADLTRAERLRQSILKRAFEGKLVPQDPNDEPASVLLERIQAERNGQEVQQTLGG